MNVEGGRHAGAFARGEDPQRLRRPLRIALSAGTQYARENSAYSARGARP